MVGETGKKKEEPSGPDPLDFLTAPMSPCLLGGCRPTHDLPCLPAAAVGVKR